MLLAHDITHPVEVCRDALRQYFMFDIQCIPIRYEKNGTKKLLTLPKKLQRAVTVTIRQSLLAQTRLHANGIAWKCGRCSGLTVVDADGRRGAALLRQLVNLAGVPHHITAHGGIHAIFAYDPTLRTASYVVVKLDCLNDRAICIVPPTPGYRWRVPLDGELRPMPDMLRDFIMDLQLEREAHRRQHDGPARHIAARSLAQLSARQRDLLERNIDRCRTLPDGKRSEADFYCMLFALRAGLDRDTIHGLVGCVGKFGTEGASYFDCTFRAAQRAAGGSAC